MNESKVSLVGYGLITALGLNVEQNWIGLYKNKSGIGKLSLFDSAHNHLPVGEVKISNSELAGLVNQKPNLPRTCLLGIKAAKEAKDSSKFNFKPWRCGFFSGTTLGGMDLTEQFMQSYFLNAGTAPLSYVKHHPCGNTTEKIADSVGISEFLSTHNTACSSSANAIMQAARMIKAGRLDLAIAGGTDSLSKFTLNGFNSLKILDSKPCRPFDESRQGLNLGEGAGYVVLVSESVRKKENLKPICYLSGYANTNDSFHQTASSPDGKGSFEAMSQALSMSNLKINQIDYINAHGTGTLNNDLSEGIAINRLFGNPDFSSTKGLTGHTLGASGSIESIFCLLAIKNQCVFGNHGFNSRMTDLTIAPIATFTQKNEINNVMSNSFGFGGNCTSLIFSKN